MPGGWGLGLLILLPNCLDHSVSQSCYELCLQGWGPRGWGLLISPVTPEHVPASSTAQKKRADSHRYVQGWVSWLHGGLQGAVTENRFNQIWDYVNLKLSG